MKFIFTVFFFFGMLNADVTPEDVSKYIAQISSSWQSEQTINSVTCKLHKGLNKLVSSKEGIIVRKSFDSKKVKAVMAYDEVSKQWAVFIPSLQNKKALKKKNFLQLYTLEPHTVFYVVAVKASKVMIQRTKIAKECRDVLYTENYKILIDSGVESGYTSSIKDAISLKSRYITQNFKNRYDDTRVALLYPDIKPHSVQMDEHYAPAAPKIALRYNSAYGGKKFYLYDYFTKNCYIGFFPSKRIPPFGMLNKVKKGSL